MVDIIIVLFNQLAGKHVMNRPAVYNPLPKLPHFSEFPHLLVHRRELIDKPQYFRIVVLQPLYFFITVILRRLVCPLTEADHSQYSLCAGGSSLPYCPSSADACTRWPRLPR